jgi:hypothetical protein
VKTLVSIFVILLATSCATTTKLQSAAPDPATLTPAAITAVIANSDKAAAMATKYNDAHGVNCWTKLGDEFRSFPTIDEPDGFCPACAIEYARLLRMWRDSPARDEAAVACAAIFIDRASLLAKLLPRR